MADKELHKDKVEQGGEVDIEKLVEKIVDVKTKSLVDENSTLREQVRRLESVADLSRLDTFDQKANKGKKITPVFRVCTINGVVVTEWKTIKDEVTTSPLTGRTTADQVYEFILQNGEHITVSGYSNFANLQYSNSEMAEEVSREIKGDDVILTLKLLGTGETIIINSKFVN
jgi:hypothetical protein